MGVFCKCWATMGVIERIGECGLAKDALSMSPLLKAFLSTLSAVADGVDGPGPDHPAATRLERRHRNLSGSLEADLHKDTARRSDLDDR